MTDVLIRPEGPGDVVAIRAVQQAAFARSAEADLVDVVRTRAAPLVSLVAELGAEIAGHILFSPVALDGNADRKVMALAPVAVTPGRQRQGIGCALVQAGLERCRALDYDGVVVLGHPEYYSRFGFVTASRYRIRCPYDVPDEAFMALELKPGGLDGASGTVRYAWNGGGNALGGT